MEELIEALKEIDADPEVVDLSRESGTSLWITDTDLVKSAPLEAKIINVLALCDKHLTTDSGCAYYQAWRTFPTLARDLGLTVRIKHGGEDLAGIHLLNCKIAFDCMP